MKKIASIALAISILILSGSYVIAADDVAQIPSCKYCGMDRHAFNFSRTYIEYDQGKPEGFCSIHCAAVDLSVNIDKIPKSIQVADYTTKELVDAEKAFWVIGGNKPGVMTKRGKWAFKDKEDAGKFITEFGGTPATFDQAMAATYEDMYQDSKMIRERRAMKRKSMEGMKH
jgi:nitrous oxide reductase accessory protein NosL